MIKKEGNRAGEIHFILSGHDHIREINKKFLNHDYDTDVISFSDNKRDIIRGEIYINIEQVKINAGLYQNSEKDELLRIMIHGVLHLLGYEDDTEDKKKMMSEKEDYYIGLGKELFMK